MGARRSPVRFAAVLLPLSLGLCTGCEKDPGSGDTCDRRPKPSFMLRVQATGATLPADMTLDVRYGAGEESYVYARPPQRPKAVFCTPSTSSFVGPSRSGEGTEVDGGDAGTDGGDIRSLECELWTYGAASITVKAAEFEPIERDLESERDDCGPRTVPVDVELLPLGDGGT